MQTIIQMRFSFFGHSGWQSDASKDPQALYAPARLRKRFEFFERIALASLRDQTDPDFKLAILSSKLMPNRFKNRLTEMCYDTLGEDHCDILFRHPGKAGRIFRRYTQRRYADHDYVSQVVLDDDDALSNDYIEVSKREAHNAVKNNIDKHGVTFLTFCNGYTLGLSDAHKAWLAPRYVPFTNLGLAQISPPSSGTHPFLTAHRKIGNRHTARAIHSRRPYYLRTVHNLNDSTAFRSKKRLDGVEQQQAIKYFPLLNDFLTSQYEEELQMAAQ